VAFDCEEFYTDKRTQTKETKEQQWWKKGAKKLQIYHINTIIIINISYLNLIFQIYKRSLIKTLQNITKPKIFFNPAQHTGHNSGRKHRGAEKKNKFVHE
jgi:hypothetical protein